MIDELSSAPKPAGAAGLIAGLILICAGACSFPLCAGFSDEMDGETAEEAEKVENPSPAREQPYKVEENQENQEN